MSRILIKSQKGYVPDELDSYLEEIGVGYYLNEKLVEAESAIENILSSEAKLTDFDDSDFEKRLEHIECEASRLILEGEVDVDDINDDIDTIRSCVKAIRPSLKAIKPIFDEPENVILNEMLNIAFALGKNVERFNLACNLEEIIQKAVQREAASISQRKTGLLNVKYQCKDDVQSIASQTLSTYPLISRRSLAIKLAGHLASEGIDAPGIPYLKEWVKEVDTRPEGYKTKRSFKYDLVLKPSQ
ncbi:hypothetical protein BIT28_26935 [Photobacterium proteolyticum]|uniref:Uncharacterized protein n=1 Tax=Photobacterium proteolyticum TaxID=1903952 RepID=A0A1Q9GSB5_9GAMM|nr:hypothetical protein [Photobacterium proteolyticum]OLQ77607.1 hypothetical protein BIT28_26935 [Photobacterium proteolyticum]